MALYFESWLMELLALLLTSSTGVYIYFLLAYQYWKKKGIPYLEPSFPLGNLKDVLLRRKNMSENFDSMYRKLKGHKFGGFYQVNRPALLVLDPDIIKNILVKDFAHFHDRGLHSDEESDPLSGNLFFMGGNRWRHLRQKVTPTFTSGRMKMMFPLIVECGEELKSHLAPFASRKDTIEIREILAKYTTDVISTCAFGIKSNSLTNPDSEFRRMGRRVLEPNIRSALRNLLTFLAPKIGAVVNMPLLEQDLSDRFMGVVQETVEHREKTETSRNDFLQLLIDIKNNKPNIDQNVNDEAQRNKNLYDDLGLTMHEIAAQVFIFFLAGFETSSTTASYCLYELALHPEIQERLRDELDSAVAEHGGKLAYEAIMSLDYLDRVVSETMRKYPVLPFLMRVCTKEYQLPGTEVLLEPGTSVVVPIHAIQNDPQYFPNPEEFDPDRFTEEAKSQRHHYTYMPFGEGPRICIGSRFGLTQTKIGISSFISSYMVDVCDDTDVPLRMDPIYLFLLPKGGIKLRISNRN